MRTVLFLRSNPVSPDVRLEKEARALIASGFNVSVLAWDRLGTSEPTETPIRNLQINRLRISGRFGSGLRNAIPLIWWQCAALWWMLSRRCEFDRIHACDLDTGIVGLVAAKLLRKPIVYDIFDLYADRLNTNHTLIAPILRRLELALIGWMDAVIICDEARRHQIAGAKFKRLAVVYNTPDNFSLNSIAANNETTLTSARLRNAYVGILTSDRFLLEMVEVVRAEPAFYLTIAGFGHLEEEIQLKASGCDRINVMGKVPYETGLSISANSDAMFAIYDPSLPNHRYSSANKLFEAMALGKPIIVARNTSMDLTVERHNLGFVIDYGDEKALFNCLVAISGWTHEKVLEFKQSANEVFVNEFSWGVMERRLVDLYRATEPTDADASPSTPSNQIRIGS